jgi:hypothetical protein
MFANQQDAIDSIYKRKRKNIYSFIQWKGSDICLDVHCECGESSHIDADFVYSVECPKCHKKYALNPFIEMVEFEDTPEGCHRIGENGEEEE